jgi:predicted RNA-binding protein associated with RNAse of E/G family
MRVDINEFNGLVCLIQLMGTGWYDIQKFKYMTIGKCDIQYQYWEFPKAGKSAICGKGMKWLQLIPDGKKHVITAKYLPDNSISVWYVDIIENIEYDTDGVAVFIDKYLDVSFTPQGDVGIADRNELDEAYNSGELSKEQYDAVLKECDLIIDELCSDIVKTESVCNKILSYVNEKIMNGEKEFKRP